MAISATFVADFTSWKTAVDAASTQLRGFQTGATQVEASLKRVADSFSGRKILSEANLAVKAIGDLGGATKLTEAEQRRLNATLTEAIAKYRTMGQVAPKAMHDLEVATRGVEEPQKRMSTSLTDVNKLLGAFGAAVSIGAVVNFGRTILEAGDHIQKMADQTGLSIEQVQRLQFVAGQSGTSVESLVGAIQNLQQRLGDDTTGAAGAMKKLGINMTEFNRLDSYSQMTRLAGAIRNVQDPTEQASVAAALFGKTWKEILPAIKAGMEETGRQATVMADETVKSLDRIGDTLKKSQQQWIAWGGTTVLAIEKVGYALGGGLGTDVMLRKFIEENDPSGLGRAMEKIPPSTLAAAAGLRQFSLTEAEAAEIEKKLTAAVRDSIDVNKAAAAARDAQRKILVEHFAVKARAADVEREAAKHWSDEEAKAFAASKKQLEDITKTFYKNQEALALDSQAKMLELLPTIDDQLTPNAMLVNGADTTIGKWGELGMSMGASIRKNMAQAFETVPDLLIRAFTGGGGLLGALKALGVQMGEAIVKPMIEAMLKRIASARFGQALAGAFGGAGGGAGSAVSTAASLGGAGATAAAGGTAAGGIGAGGTTVGAGIGLGTTLAITGGVAAGALLAWAIWKKGLFRGGEESLKVNPRRDAFFGQFGGPGSGEGSGFRKIADKIFSITGSDELVRMMAAAQKQDQFVSAQSALVAALRKGGVRARSFATGGFVPPGDVVQATLHGGSFGEDVVPRRTSGSATTKQTVVVNNSISFSVQALDTADFQQVFHARIVPLLKLELLTNQTGLVSRLNTVVG